MGYSVQEYESFVQCHEGMYMNLFGNVRQDEQIEKGVDYEMDWYLPPTEAHCYYTEFQKYDSISYEIYYEYVLAIESLFSKN